MAILVKDPGLATTVQDLGRFGYAHLGISPSGAADELSFRIANRLVGNADNAAALEMTLIGGTFSFDAPAVVAVTGAGCPMEVDGSPASDSEAVVVPGGATLKCGHLKNGARAYVAIQGGIDVPLLMGSASTFMGAQFGGVDGRRLKRGDVLSVGRVGRACARKLRSGVRLSFGIEGETVLRATRGAQQDWFDENAFATLFTKPFIVSEQSGRTGLRLSGEQLAPKHARQLLTDGIPLGAVQVPADGQPIILLVDQQTTGGYPKIANVIAADMHKAGQLRARDMVRFKEVSIADAIDLLCEQERRLESIFESE